MARKGMTVTVQLVNAYREARHLREREAVLFGGRVATVESAEFVYVDDVRMVKVFFTFHWQGQTEPPRQHMQVFEPEYMLSVVEFAAGGED